MNLIIFIYNYIFFILYNMFSTIQHPYNNINNNPDYYDDDYYFNLNFNKYLGIQTDGDNKNTLIGRNYTENLSNIINEHIYNELITGKPDEEYHIDQKELIRNCAMVYKSFKADI